MPLRGAGQAAGPTASAEAPAAGLLAQRAEAERPQAQPQGLPAQPPGGLPPQQARRAPMLPLAAVLLRPPLAQIHVLSRQAPRQAQPLQPQPEQLEPQPQLAPPLRQVLRQLGPSPRGRLRLPAGAAASPSRTGRRTCRFRPAFCPGRQPPVVEAAHNVKWEVHTEETFGHTDHRSWGLSQRKVERAQQMRTVVAGVWFINARYLSMRLRAHRQATHSCVVQLFLGAKVHLAWSFPMIIIGLERKERRT